MSLPQFFETMGAFLQGHSDVHAVEAELGPLQSEPADLQFYPWLVAFDQRRILAELYPAVRALVDRTLGLDWGALVAQYVADRVPEGHSVPGLGEALPDWLAARREQHPGQPEALECLADLRWVRFLASTAPDVDGVGVDVRLFVRHYPLDVLALEAALLRDPAAELPPTGPRTLLVYRHVDNDRVFHRVPSLATLAVLARAQGMALAGPLADLEVETLQAEELSLQEAGVLRR